MSASEGIVHVLTLDSSRRRPGNPLRRPGRRFAVYRKPILCLLLRDVPPPPRKNYWGAVPAQDAILAYDRARDRAAAGCMPELGMFCERRELGGALCMGHVWCRGIWHSTLPGASTEHAPGTAGRKRRGATHERTSRWSGQPGTHTSR